MITVTDISSLLIPAAAVAVAVAAALVAFWAARYQKRQNELTSILLIYQMLSTQEATDIRRRIYGRHVALEKGVPRTPKEENEVSKVSGDLDLIGSLVEERYVSKDVIMKLYSGMICNMWQILKHTVGQERLKRREPIFKHYFEKLAEDAKKYREVRHLEPITIREPWNPEEAPSFLVERFQERIERPVSSNYTLRIRCIGGTYEKIRVWFDGKQCFSERSNEAVTGPRIFTAGDVLNFRIPATTTPSPEMSFLEITDDNQLVYKKKWDDINWTTP